MLAQRPPGASAWQSARFDARMLHTLIEPPTAPDALHRPRAARSEGEAGACPFSRCEASRRTSGPSRPSRRSISTSASGRSWASWATTAPARSTLVKIIAGNYPPSAGDILLDGRVGPLPPAPRRARERDRDRVPGPRPLRQPHRRRQRVPRAGGQAVGRPAPLPPTTGRCTRGPRSSSRSSSPRPARGTWCARCRAGSARRWRSRRTRLSDPGIVLMDEPTAAISVRQVAEVLDLIRQLRDTDHAVVLISHRMPDVFSVCDRVAVLRRGRKVADKPIRRHLARGDHGPHHGSHRERMNEAASQRPHGHSGHRRPGERAARAHPCSGRGSAPSRSG